ncbi:glycosyltransferase family 2 protein [Rubellimicrobium roseum]|uniref:glycosyltransferase family 2 protein n=1 Tax=Rubellimicrobium roseum TaxID=687525 RepID=UPI00159BD1E1|nr:glycosyltransferase family 2 protein [Rubellimicrobium roseum]
MKISVIIPTFNNEDTLGATVRSVLAQDHGDLEAVVVNDGGRSPSGFLDISDPRLRVIDLPSNGGVSRARNRGFHETSGELVLFLDSDDVVAPDLLSFAARVLSDPAIAVLAVGHETVEDDVIRDKGLVLPTHRSEGLRTLSARDSFDLMRRRPSALLPSGMVFRRRVVADAAGPEPFHTGLKIAQDTLMILLVAWKNEIRLSDDKYFIYRVRPDSLSRNERRTLLERIEVMDICAATIRQAGGDPALVDLARRMRQNSARRVARLLRQDGDRHGARRILAADLRHRFNWKSAVEYAATLARR